MSELRLIVFDMDGTLIDSQAVILRAMGAAFDAAGLPLPPRERVLSIVGLSLPTAMATLAPEAGAEGHETLVARYKESFVIGRESGAAPEAPLYPGALDTLTRFAAEPATLLGVATGKARRGLDHVYEVLGIGRFFQTSQTADGHPSKPHPSMLLAAAAETGVEPGAGVMIGDTEFDIEMGRAAGFRTVGVTWGYHPVERLEAARPDHIVGSFPELYALLSSRLEIAG